MRRRALVAGSLAGVASSRAQAQTAPARRPARVGYLAGRDGPQFQAFRGELPLVGLVEGRDVVIEFRSAQGRAERLPGLVAELVALDVAAVVTNTSTAAVAARAANSSVPIGFSMLGDPVGLGLVECLAWPGRNATGIAAMSEEMSSKRLQLLRQLVPSATRVALLLNPAIAITAAEIAATEGAASRLGVELRVLRAGRVEEIAPMLAAVAACDAQAVMVQSNALLAAQPHTDRVVRAVAAARLPAVYVEPDWIAAGGLMTYAPSLVEFGRHFVRIVARILRGVKPVDLPPIILVQADEVIE